MSTYGNIDQNQKLCTAIKAMVTIAQSHTYLYILAFPNKFVACIDL